MSCSRGAGDGGETGHKTTSGVVRGKLKSRIVDPSAVLDERFQMVRSYESRDREGRRREVAPSKWPVRL